MAKTGHLHQYSYFLFSLTFRPFKRPLISIILIALLTFSFLAGGKARAVTLTAAQGLTSSTATYDVEKPSSDYIYTVLSDQPWIGVS